jgi:hypothetical protein
LVRIALLHPGYAAHLVGPQQRHAQLLPVRRQEVRDPYLSLRRARLNLNNQLILLRFHR